jgi:hypothetical protein
VTIPMLSIGAISVYDASGQFVTDRISWSRYPYDNQPGHAVIWYGTGTIEEESAYIVLGMVDKPGTRLDCIFTIEGVLYTVAGAHVHEINGSTSELVRYEYMRPTSTPTVVPSAVPTPVGTPSPTPKPIAPVRIRCIRGTEWIPRMIAQ